jgi:hypothetical protein
MTQEFLHVFKGFGRVQSQCLVRMYSDDGETFICFIDLGVGTSVTNASEQIATEIVNEYHLNPSDCRFFETYQQYDYDNFDEIEYKWEYINGKPKAEHPNWKPSDEEHLKQIFITTAL